MNSHTKRKFVGNVKLDFPISGKNTESDNDLTKLNFDEYTKAYIQLEDNTVITGFVYLHKGKPLLIPEPEPSNLYFTNAESKLADIIKLQENIFKYEISKHRATDLSHVFFNFFQLSSDFVINIFTSIEAYNNGLIHDDFEIEFKNEVYDKKRAQRFIDFSTKFKKVIPKIMKKSFVKDYPKDYEYILKLKDLRDNALHIKNLQEGFFASYRELYKNYLGFDYFKAYEITKKYFNYYIENWVEKCDCGK